MHPLALFQALLLLSVANSIPMAAKWVCGRYFAYPLDANLIFLDGRPLFGSSKTIRGLVCSLILTAVAASALGLDVRLGLLVAANAMAGDLLSSFFKRRLGLKPGNPALGLDQIPESLFPLVACQSWLGMSAADIVAGVAIFLIGEVAVSRVLFQLGLRDRPY